MGAHVFYLQEMAADEPRRVMGQQILSFVINDKRKIRSPLQPWSSRVAGATAIRIRTC